MSSGWKECKLGDTGKVVTGKTPSKDNPEDWGSDILFITPSDYKDYGKKAYSSIRKLSEIGTERQKSRLLPPLSVLVTCIGSDMGKSVVNAVPCVTNQQINAIIPNKSVVNEDYLYYLTVDLYETLRSLGGDGTAVPILNKTDFENIDILFPPLPEQRAIAGVLSSLDDKIDLLHRQNKTLEGMAEAIWRKMFVEEADPKWKAGPLSDYVEVIDNRGKTPPFIETETNYPIIEVNALTGMGRLVNYTAIRKYVTEETYNTWFRSGHPKINDTLISTVGSVGEMSMFLIEKGTIAQNVVALRATHTSPFYLYQYLRYFQNDIKEYDIGSVQPSIKVTHFVKMDLMQPDDEKLKIFDIKMHIFTDKIIVNSVQISTLSRLRDTLLPKLMSGEVRVKL